MICALTHNKQLCLCSIIRQGAGLSVSCYFMQDEDELEEGVETSPVAGRRLAAHALGPGRVVWAKVEGHDWWPARIVRCGLVPGTHSELVWNTGLQSLYGSLVAKLAVLEPYTCKLLLGNRGH